MTKLSYIKDIDKILWNSIHLCRRNNEKAIDIYLFNRRNYGWKEIEIAVDADGNTDSPWICTTHLTSGGVGAYKLVGWLCFNCIYIIGNLK